MKISGELIEEWRHILSKIMIDQRKVEALISSNVSLFELKMLHEDMISLHQKAIQRLGGGTKADSKKSQMEGIIFNRAGDLDTRYYPVRKRAISGAVKVGMPGLKMAIEKVMKDMNVYLARKNKEASDKLKL